MGSREGRTATYFSIGTAALTALLGVFLMLGGIEFYATIHPMLVNTLGAAGSTVAKFFAAFLSGSGVPLTYTGGKALLALAA